MISRISSRVGAGRIFVVKSNGGGNIPTPTPTPTIIPTETPLPTPTETITPTPTIIPTETITPTPTETIVPTSTPTPLPTDTPTPLPTDTPTPTPTGSSIPDNDLTYTLIPNNDLVHTFIPDNDLLFTLVPGDDLSYTLLPDNDLNPIEIPNNDLLFTLVPNGDLTYVFLPDNDIIDVLLPDNDVTYNLIPNGDLTYTLIPNNDVKFKVLKPPTVFYGQIRWGEDMYVCNGGPEFPTFYVTGDGPTFCESNIFVANEFTGLSGYIFMYYDGQVKTVNVNNTNIATLRDNCVPCPTPTPTPEPCYSGYTVSNCGTSHVYNVTVGVPWMSYGENYLQVGPSQDGGGLIAPQAGWYFVDDCGRVRQLLNTPIWVSGGQNSPWPNGNGWLCVVNSPFTVVDSVSTLTFCESQPTVSQTTPTPTSTETPTPTPTITDTPTPSPTPVPFDFTLIWDCTSNGSSEAYGFVGGSGQYDMSTGVFTTENDALNAGLWNQLANPGVHAGVTYNSNGTFWVAIRDRNNQTLKLAKSVTISC